MTSESFKILEERAAETHVLHDALVHEIAYKLKEGDPHVVERALYKAGVTAGTRPIETAHVVNEFLVFLADGKRPKERGEQ